MFVINVSGAFSAVSALVNEGHEDIAIISGPMSSIPGRERFFGYENALRSNSIQVKNDLVFYGDFSLESGYEITKEILNLKQRPTAIFAANNMMATGSVKALMEEGLSIPDDISFICFDDVEMFDIMNMNISTVSRPTEAMGEVAGEMLFELIESTPIEQTQIKEIVLKTELILRGSEKFC